MKEIKKYETWMHHCIELGKIAKSQGDAPVGCILVKEGEIIAEGIEAGKSKEDLTCHAEIEAIRRARKTLGTDLSNCIMITTHEPCMMCSYVIRHHRVKKVIFGISTGEIGGYSSALPILTTNQVKRWASPPIVIGGVLEKECRML